MGQNSKMGHFWSIFKIKFLSLKQILLLPYVFISYINLIIVCIVPSHTLSAGGNRYLKNTAWSRMSNFVKPGGDDNNHGENADSEAQVKI